MSRSRQTAVHVLLVPVAILIFLMLAFFLYYLIFMFVARMFRPGAYNYVSLVRGGYGIILLAVGILMQRTRYPSWVRAGLFASGVGVFSVTMSILLYETPILSMGVVIASALVSMIYFVMSKKEWFYYYGVILSAAAALFYIR
ncbi:hypothetical protein ACHAL6_15040 [Proteiniclasticum sp. C24MP]|uniref:hypothetical protein n=1 Tax=Proteiniclasticum sp. C24MP TaxID=3374101 RepID=UPI003754AD6B